MFERFSSPVRRALVVAQDEARLLDHNFIGTEHLLLALLHEDQQITAAVLGSIGLTPDGARERVATMVGPRLGEPTGAPPFTPRAKKALESSLREALQLGHNFISSEHLLLGLLRDPQSVAFEVITGFGTTPELVRRLLLGQMGLFMAAPTVEPSLPRMEPRCPGCHASVQDFARHRTVQVQSDPAISAPALPAVIVFCSSCGNVLPAMSPPFGSQEP